MLFGTFFVKVLWIGNTVQCFKWGFCFLLPQAKTTIYFWVVILHNILQSFVAVYHNQLSFRMTPKLWPYKRFNRLYHVGLRLVDFMRYITLGKIHSNHCTEVLEASTELRTEHYRVVPNVGPGYEHLNEAIMILMIRVHSPIGWPWVSKLQREEGRRDRNRHWAQFQILKQYRHLTHILLTRESHGNKDFLIAYLHLAAQKRHSDIKRTSLLS